MKATILRVAVFAILLSGLAVWFMARKTSADPQIGFGQPLCIAQVPAAWGEFKGGSAQSGFAFQDNVGTLRFVTNVPCDGTPQVALEIHRTR